MKKLIISLTLSSIVSMINAQNFLIPERTTVQKHNRAVYLTYANVIPGIAYAKSTGKTVEEYAAFVGDLFKTSWNKENGFSGLVNGTLFNFESFKREQDPPMEILEQSDRKIVIKWKINYKNRFNDGPVYNVTYDEFNQWFEIVNRKIVEYFDATYKQEVKEDDWLLIIITK